MTDYLLAAILFVLVLDYAPRSLLYKKLTAALRYRYERMRAKYANRP